MSEFKGSIAQVNVQFPIETVIEPVAGKNYTRALIYMHVNLAADNLPGIDTPAAGMKIELDSSSYGSVTGDALKKWLVPFFTAAQAAKLAVVLYDTASGDDPATAPIGDVYEATKYWAYFKFGFAAAADYNALQVSLATLCVADPLYSQLWVGTSDVNVLSKTSALITALNGAEADARVIYNPDTNINPALAQLGDSLAVANVTGTPVGNDTDMHGFNTIKASGATDSEGNVGDLTATQKAALDEQFIGYNTWVGDGTENVVTEGSKTLKGNVVGAQWVKCYIEYMCKIRTANFITRRNKFRNNAEYQATLCILSDVVKGFLDFGRLNAFKITAPVFANLPKSADALTVPNAWEATYIDKIRSVTVYGTLYVTQPTK
jgi:hypothetical protein